jgi:hypothetical protein
MSTLLDASLVRLLSMAASYKPIALNRIQSDCQSKMGAMATPESFFSYAVSRPFPFRWFTPVALVGGLIFSILFTFLNFASSGYDMIVQPSSDPNATVSQAGWLQHWPSFMTAKVQPTCQPINLPVNSQLFTNQTALTYTMTGVWQHDEGSDDRKILASLTYHNNVLENCSVTAVEVDLAALDRSGNQIAFAEWGAVVRTYTTCQTHGTAGRMFVNLTQTYDYIPDTTLVANLDQFLGTGFQSRDAEARASLWWGETLMSAYWGVVTWEMQQERQNKTLFGEPGIRKGTVSFTPNDNVTDISNPSFFNLDYRFIVDSGLGSFTGFCCPDLPLPLSAANMAPAQIYPNIWADADLLAKAAYSTVLVDLGQATGSNMLTDASLLSSLTSNFSYVQTLRANFRSGPANGSYDSLKGSNGPLGTTPSIISTTYLCQVPQLKSAGGLIIAVLVADLVFMQVTWQVYKLVATAYLTRIQPTANYCPACL